MKWVMILLLALAVCAGAVELYWDDGHDHGRFKLYYPAIAVYFHEYEGPGDTGGQDGTVYAFRVFYYKDPGENPVSFYLYTAERIMSYYLPDEPLYDYPLDYEQDEDGDWIVYTLVEPKRVPGDFFVVLFLPSDARVHLTDRVPSRQQHSAYLDGETWEGETDDYRLRVEWEPLDTAIEETSWGAIKATY